MGQADETWLGGGLEGKRPPHEREHDEDEREGVRSRGSRRQG